MIRVKHLLLTTCAFIWLSAGVHADIFDYTINGNFGDGGTFLGTFTIDTAASQFTSASFTTSGGGPAFFPSTTYDLTDNIIANCSGDPCFNGRHFLTLNDLFCLDIPRWQPAVIFHRRP